MATWSLMPMGCYKSKPPSIDRKPAIDTGEFRSPIHYLIRWVDKEYGVVCYRHRTNYKTLSCVKY